MNIFMTHSCPAESARQHCVIHRNKMIIELSQMLSTAHWLSGNGLYASTERLYKPTHQNHPSNVFVRSSTENYMWAYRHLVCLHNYYENHRGVPHASKRILLALARIPERVPKGELNPVLAADDDLAHQVANECGVVEGYRIYMNHKFRDWISRPKPVKIEWVFGIPDWVEGDIYRYALKCGSK